MGRNGAGKSTLLRVAAGLLEPTRGKVRAAGRVALLLQNPGDYALRDRLGDELPPDALAAAGLDGLADRHPRDLSGGERQRLALAIVLHGPRPAVVCLDEPTRGMDRGHKDRLVALLHDLAGAGSGVVVATHDAEFAAAFAARTVLLGDGRAGGRRTDGRRAGRRLVLRHPDGAHPRRRRAAARGRRRPAAARGGRPVSWIAASMLLLGLALVAGFGWYERSHPSARVLALVAALAALAVIGRIAFAPIPNVKPTTDIVLLTGYVLGGAPGFAVGAVAALASNLFFGQGPWTPWQMVGWGGVGLFGAALARLAGRDLGRVPLAVACAVASLGYGFLQNVSLWITFSGDHSLDKLWFYMSTSFAFDVAHATGSVLFCLAFGPALVRALRRYRTRFEVTWRPGPVTAGVGAILIAVALAQPPSADAAAPRAAVRYLEAAQNADGGLRARSAHGVDADAHGLGGARARRGRRGTRATSSAAARTRWTSCARTRTPCAATSASARGRCSPCARRARRRGGWAAATCSASCCGRRSATGRSRAWSTRRRSPSWRCARPASRRAIPRCGARSRSSPARRTRTAASTSPARAARRAPTTPAPRCRRSARRGRRDARVTRRAADWLERHQNPDGGFSLQVGASNAQSTAWAVQGLIAAGRDPARVRRGGARSPLAYLRSLVAPGGAIRYSRTSDQTPVWVTGQALTALAGKALPLAPVRRERSARAASAPAPAAPAAPAATPRRPSPPRRAGAGAAGDEPADGDARGRARRR